MEVNVKAMREWVAALRSGDYKQGRAALKAPAEQDQVVHCCLGVACEVAIANGAKVKESIDSCGMYWFDDRQGVLPNSVMSWYGLPVASPKLTDELDAIAANDEMEMDFEQIADLLVARYHLEDQDA